MEKELFNRLRWPLSCIAGVLVIVFYCVFTFMSAATFPPPWSPLDTWLSDFGNSTYNPSGYVFYNAGCILTGLALIPFYLGLYKWYTNEPWRKILIVVTQIVGIASGFALMMIGVFPETSPPWHHIWSMVFFILNLLVLTLANVSLLTHPRFIKPIAIYGFIVAGINLVLVAVNIGGSLVEWLTVFTALGFAGLLVLNMLMAFRVTKKSS